MSPPKKKSPNQRLIGGRYRPLQELGRGAGGIVYLAADEHLRGKKLAVKVLEIRKSQFSLLAASLKNEFSTLSLLHHKNLAEVYDFGASPQEIYFSSEWVDGQDILKATSRADLNTVFQLIVQILRAVDFLHRRGVLHLDLKPANILVTDPDRTGELKAKLIDFGIAQWKRKDKLGPGEFSGTPPYAAPEIIMEKPATSASDIYSLGIILHQVFAGRLPFRSSETFEMMQEQIYQDPLRMEEINPALPEDFPDLLQKMVSRDPTHRFQSPREVLDAINQSLGENFSLRSPTAPIHILKESDYFFRAECLEELVAAFKSLHPDLILLTGPHGIGKSHLMGRVKERLQIEGVYPLLFQDLQALKDFLKLGVFSPQTPLFIDFGAEEEKDLKNWTETLREIKCPLLISTRLGLPQNESARKIELGALSRDSILEFLKNEVADFPLSTHDVALADLSQGLPLRLEELLQAMREEGAIQWTDRGWQWRSEIELDFSKLLERHQFRWKERLRRTQEVLKFSKAGLDSKILEGILGLDTGAMEEKLAEWAKAGVIARQAHEGSPLYFAHPPSPTDGAFELPTDWSWVKRELEDLYERDEYEKGVEWARLLESKSVHEDPIPSDVALCCARHYVASGDPKKALQTLPELPDSIEAQGLFHEIRARALWSLGNLKECGEAIHQGEKCYEACHDKIGLASLSSLEGWVFTRLQRLEEAESSFTKALTIAQESLDPYITASSQMNLGALYYNQGRFDRAQSAYQKAFFLSARFDHPLLSCSIRQNWINLLFYMGRAQDARTLCYDLLKRAIQSHFPHQQAAALNYLALLEGQADHREQQLQYLNQAIGLLNPERPTALLNQLLINRSYVYCDLKKFTPAQLDGEAALNLAENRSNFALSSSASLILGKIFRDRPRADLDSASQFFEKAHQKILENPNRQVLWEINFERGLLAKKQKRADAALQYFLSAEKDLKSMLEEMPEEHRESYLRDRKLEKIVSELESIRSAL